MRRLTGVVAVLAVSLWCHAAAAAEDCPYSFGGDEAAADLVKGLDAAPTCESAAKLHSACAWGSSADATFAETVVGKCEARFLTSLDPARLAVYRAHLQHCADKYAHEQGTMYIGFTAFCQEEVALAFAKNPAAASQVKVPPIAPVKASFNCEKARAPLELVICSEDDIGAADMALAKTYAAAIGKASGELKATLTTSERGWLDFVAAKCAVSTGGTTAHVLTRACVRAAFEVRNDQIGLCLAKPDEQRQGCLGAYTILADELPK